MNSNYKLRDYNLDDIRDAERLGRMFVSFDSAWPGGFVNGVEPNPEHMFESMRRMQRLAICVVEHQDEMVGYCDLHAQTGNTDLAYIPLLGASPEHHGKGVGKALLLEMIRRVTAMGFRELTLNTWPGNLKAVPLYKKTGFHWEPETSVLMRNFLPGLLSSAPGKAFFDNIDWYNCHDRSIELASDDVKWMGMRVFPYTFRAGENSLKATFEMASGGMTALETNDYSIWCSIPSADGQAPAGETLPISWHISPKPGEAVDVILLTEGDDGLDIKVREHLHVSEPTDITRDVRVLADAEPRRRGERERCVRSTLILNGVPVVLETGVQVVRAISIEYAGQGLIACRAEQIEVCLKNNIDRPVSGTLSLDAHPGLEGAGATFNFSLPARSSTQCTLSLTGAAPGACYTNLRYEAGGFRGVRPAAFRVLGSIAPVGSLDTTYDEEAILESPGVKITQKLRGGGLEIENKSAGNTIYVGMAEPGPPFATMRRSKLLMKGRLQQNGAELTSVLRAEYPEFPGLIVERHVTQIAGDLVRIDYHLFNTTGTSIQHKLRMGLMSMHGDYLVVPTESGVVREPCNDWDPYPMGGEDVLRSPDAMSESWLAAESEHNVSGIIWHGKAQLEMDWHSGLTLDPGEICANSSIAMPPVYLVVGAGSWESVRGWWLKLVQPAHVKEKIPPKARRALSVRTVQSPLLLSDSVTNVDLLIENDRGRPLTANITLEAAGLSVEPAAISIKDVNRDNSVRSQLVVSDSDGYGAGTIRATIIGEANSQVFKLPVIRVSAPGAISVQQESDGRYLVQNGVLSYRVAPDFVGSITELRADGMNHLHSSWPQPEPFVWFNPWYGGIHLYLDESGHDALLRERFTGEPVERVGETGLRWHGVRIACEPKHRDLRWLKLEAEYLTLPGSDLLALIYRWSNISEAKQYVVGGIATWSAVGGDRAQSVAHWSNEGELRHRRRSALSMGTLVGRWAAVENGVTGHRLEAVAGGSEAKAGFSDMAAEGVHLGVTSRITLDPGETRETICWLVVNPAIAEFEAYAALSEVAKLP